MTPEVLAWLGAWLAAAGTVTAGAMALAIGHAAGVAIASRIAR